MLGQKLKEARIEAGLSQRQLCGETITRNMLSQIESGKARPSMQTLTYLAQKLSKPVSWFLEETPEPQPVEQTPTQALQYYQTGQYQSCLELLDGEDGSAEIWFLRALCLLSLAKEAIGEDKLHYARSLLEKTAQAGKHTPYYTPALERERLLCLYQCSPEQAGEWAGKLPKDDRELLLRAQSSLASSDADGCMTILNAVREQNATWHYMYGQAAMLKTQYEIATEHFLAAEEAYPIPCAKALENCYRELEDYKMAYQYACKQR
nr:helix-turn-helix transcriptional regulator [Oscillospiraceae bacterium]